MPYRAASRLALVLGSLLSVFSFSLPSFAASNPLIELVVRIEYAADFSSYGTGWFFDADDAKLYFLAESKRLKGIKTSAPFQILGALTTATTVPATLEGVAPGYGVAVFSIPRKTGDGGRVENAMKLAKDHYLKGIPDAAVRVGICGVLKPLASDKRLYACDSVLYARVPNQPEPSENPFELSASTRIGTAPCPVPFAAACYDVPVSSRLMNGGGLAVSLPETSPPHLYLAGITVLDQATETTRILPIQTALLAAELIRTRAANRVFLTDSSLTFEQPREGVVTLLRGPLAGKIVYSMETVRPAITEPPKELPGPFRNNRNHWIGFGWYSQLDQQIESPQNWSTAENPLIHFPGIKTALPHLASLVRRRAGFRIGKDHYLRLNGEAVNTLSEFCEKYRGETEAKLDSEGGSLEVPAQLSLNPDYTAGIHSFADIRRLVPAEELRNKLADNDTGFTSEILDRITPAYLMERSVGDPLKSIDVLIAHAAQTQYAMIGKASVTRDKGKVTISSFERVTGETRLEMTSDFKTDGSNRRIYVGPIRIGTRSRASEKPLSKYFTNAWGVVSIEKVLRDKSQGGGHYFQVTAVVAHRVPPFALGTPSRLTAEKIALDSFSFRAE